MNMWILMTAILMKQMVNITILKCFLYILILPGAIHPTTGEYSYFMTTTYPWVPMYYYGDGETSDLCSAA